MTWLTISGRRVTAATRADAERLAAEYGLGQIAGRARAPARPEPDLQIQALVVWDDLCQVVRAEGASALRYWVEERTQDEPAEWRIRTPRGLRKPTAGERRAINRLLREASE